MEQATDLGFSNSILSSGGMVAFLLVWVFVKLLCFRVGGGYLPQTFNRQKLGPQVHIAALAHSVDADQSGEEDKRTL